MIRLQRWYKLRTDDYVSLNAEKSRRQLANGSKTEHYVTSNAVQFPQSG